MEFAFVDIDDLVEIQPTQIAEVEVDLALLLVSGEWAIDATPEFFIVDQHLSAHRFVGMSPEYLRGFYPQCAGANRFELQEGRLTRYTTICTARYQKLGFSVQRNLLVGDRMPSSGQTIGAIPWGNCVPFPVALMTVPQPPQLPHLPEPSLPLVMNLVSVLEDIEILESEGFLHEFASVPEVFDSQVGGQRTPIGVGHLTRMDNVLPPTEILSLLRQYMLLHRPDNQGLI